MSKTRHHVAHERKTSVSDVLSIHGDCVGSSAWCQEAETKCSSSHIDRYVSTLTIVAAIFITIRLVRENDIDLNVSRFLTTIQQGVRLDRTILDEARRP